MTSVRPSGGLEAGVVRATDQGGLPLSLLDAIDGTGGLWMAGDYYASAATIVSSALANNVRALRLDARDLGLLRELPALEFLHLRSDGRPPVEAVASLPDLRALIIETGALRGTLNLAAHPRLEWLKVKVSGKGGRENLPAVLEGHATLRHLQLNEVPFKDLGDIARAFPSLQTLRVWGGDTLRDLGDLAPWKDTLESFSSVFVPLRSIEPLTQFTALRFVGLSLAKLPPLTEFHRLPGLRYLSLMAGIPSLAPLVGHPRLRIARLAGPDDGDLTPLSTLPALTGLIGKRWLDGEHGVPFLEGLPPDHELVEEWRRATDSSESLLSP
jgi:hypothetical protein